jgi:NitT/TauT family transport system permease protein
MSEASSAEQKFLAAEKKRRLEKRMYFLGSFVLLAVVWEGSRALGIVNPGIFPSILSVCKAGVAMIADGTLIMHCLTSFGRVLAGFSMGIIGAVIVGFILGNFRPARLLLDPLIGFFRALPPIALIPLMIIFFGIGETSKIVVLTYASFFPAVVVIYQALVGQNPLYFRAAQTLGATRMELFRLILLPQLVPAIITACRVSLGVCWATLVAAELIAAQRGIGAMMTEAQNFFQMPPMVLGILLIGVISLFMDAVVRHIERKVTAWEEKLPN